MLFRTISIFVVFLIGKISADCPDGSLQSPDGSLCYQVVQTELTYNEAKIACGLLSGGLPLVPNAFINSFLSGELKEVSLSYSWLPYYYSDGAYIGEDGNKPSFTNWGFGEPTLSDGYAAILSSNDGRWFTYPTNSSFHFICAFPPPQCLNSKTTKSPIIRTTTTTFSPFTTSSYYGSCVPSFRDNQNPCLDNTWRYYPRTCSCYKILNSTYFEQAQEDCSNLFPGSNLASIHSDSEAIFVSDMVIAAIENDNWEVHHDGEDDTIIGLYRTQVGAPWQHTDHTPYDFFPWIAPDTSINNNYGTLITSSAPGYRGFGGVYSTENYIIRTAVCKYQL